MPKYLQHVTVLQGKCHWQQQWQNVFSILQIFCGVLKYAGRFHCMLINIPEYVFQLFVNIL